MISQNYLTSNICKKYYFWATILILILYALGLVDLRLPLIFFFPLIILLLIRIILSRRLIFFLILSLYFILPQLDRYQIIPEINWLIATAFILISIFYTLLKLKFDSSFNFLFLIFTIWLVFQLLRGISFHNPPFYILNEVVKFFAYSVGFYFILSITDIENLRENLKYLVFLILILGVIIAFQMLFYYVNITNGGRVLTRQANLLLVCLMTALSILRFYKLNLTNKILLILMSFLYIIGILLFMQRSLWVGALVSIIVFVFLSSKSSKLNFKTIVSVLLIVIVLVGGVLLFYSKFALDKELFADRTASMEEGVEASSMVVRILSFIEVFHVIKENPIIGKGMGDFIITSYLIERRLSIVDNSFIVVIWKYGLVGFIILSLIFIKSFKQMLFIIKNSEDKLFLVVTITIFASFIGHTVNGLGCVVLTMYHFNFIWGVFFAVIEVIKKSIPEPVNQVNDIA